MWYTQLAPVIMQDIHTSENLKIDGNILRLLLESILHNDEFEAFCHISNFACTKKFQNKVTVHWHFSKIFNPASLSKVAWMCTYRDFPVQASLRKEVKKNRTNVLCALSRIVKLVSTSPSRTTEVAVSVQAFFVQKC